MFRKSIIRLKNCQSTGVQFFSSASCNLNGFVCKPERPAVVSQPVPKILITGECHRTQNAFLHCILQSHFDSWSIPDGKSLHKQFYFPLFTHTQNSIIEFGMHILLISIRLKVALTSAIKIHNSIIRFRFPTTLSHNNREALQ